MPIPKKEGITSPRAQIITATEALLIEGGPSMATVRAITSAASVNIGAISYHFGSRDNLMIAICSRHMEVANEDILDDLTRLKHQTGEVFVEDIFRPLINTAFEVWMHDHVLRGLRAFLFLDNELNKKLDSSSMGIVYKEMYAILQKACPWLEYDAIRRRFGFAMGAVMHVIYRLDGDTTQAVGSHVVEDLLAFVAGGFAQLNEQAK